MGDVVTVTRENGEVSYKARIRRRGEKPLTKTFRRKTDAAKWIQHSEAQLLSGKGLPRPKRHTVSDAIARYLIDVLPHKKASTQSVQRQMLSKLKSILGDYRFVEVDYDVLAQARGFLQTEEVRRIGVEEPQFRGPASVNRYFALLNHIYSVAIRDWSWADLNPVSKMRPLREPKGRERSLTDDELKTIMAGLARHDRADFRLIVKLALITGARRGNCETLEWQHVDLDARTVSFPDTKNNKPHVAPITEELCDELKEYRRATGVLTGPVFPSKPGSARPSVDVKQVWRRFAADVGLKDLRFHDLRHAVGSHLAKQNVSLHMIAKLLGHRSLESTKRYAHLGVQDVVPHVEELGARLRRVK